MSTVRIALTTTANRPQAERIARALIDQQLAACVNIVAGVHSVYRWEGKVEAANECLLLIKTQQERVTAVRDLVHQLHTYQVPEFLVIEVDSGSADYLAWIASSVL